MGRATRLGAAGDSLCSSVFAISGAWLVWHAWADVWLGDSGEVGSAAYVLGVAHPTGFPLDMLLLRLAAFLPLGPIAFRENVAVALISALALRQLAELALLVCERAGIGDALGRRVGVVYGVCMLLTFTTFLDSALAVEVYSTSLLLVLAAACAALRAGPERGAAWALAGLALATHVTAPLLMLPVLCALLVARVGARNRLRMICMRAWPALSCALVIAYLTLASLRDPMLDWGNPETLAALIDHLSAARIRTSYSQEMFASTGTAAFLLLRQLFEHRLWLAPALLGFVALSLRARQLALVLASVVVVDLAYAVWVNPMGVAARQLGHATGAALALGCALGVAELCGRAIRWPALRMLVVGIALVAALTPCVRAAWPAHDEGYVFAERHGSGSPLASLPPRSAFFCSSDVACAAGLFAVYAEGARPDMSVAPAQHLWDAAVLRRLHDLDAIQRRTPRTPLAAHERRAFADHVVGALYAQPAARPIFFETNEPISAGAPAAQVVAAAPAPYVQVAPGRVDPARAKQALAQVDSDVRIRCGARSTQSARCHEAWFDAYQTIGESALLGRDLDNALAAFQRAVTLVPTRALGFANLSVVLEARGALWDAVTAARRAIALDASRPTPWVNLTRLVLRLHGPQAAQQVGAAAQAAGIVDTRLDQVVAQAAAAQGSTAK